MKIANALIIHSTFFFFFFFFEILLLMLRTFLVLQPSWVDCSDVNVNQARITY